MTPTPTPPPAPAPKPPRPKGIREQQLKRHILFLMLPIKLIAVLVLLTHWQSGGFTGDQFASALGLLLPVLTAYTSLIFKDFVEHRHISEDTSPPVRRSFQWTVYAVFFVYGWVLWLLPGMKAQGAISFVQYSTFLTLTESGLGIYVGQIVFALFKQSGPPASGTPTA